MKKLLALVLMVLPFAAFACLNGFHGSFREANDAARANFPVPKGNPLGKSDTDLFRMTDEFEAEYKKGKYEGSVNYSVILIYGNRFEEAEKVCREIAKKWPNKYESAANLGTILEVNGKNEEALKLIKKALEIDSLAHDGSEWIHVKVLEAKLNPGVKFVGSKVTGIDFGQDSLPKAEVDELALKRLQKELFYQLNERVTFIDPKDVYIGELMFELGNVTLARGQNNRAKEIYEIAKRFGYKGKLYEKRYAESQKPSTYMETASDSTATEEGEGSVGEGEETTEDSGPPSTVALVFMGLGLALVIGLFWRVFEGKAK